MATRFNLPLDYSRLENDRLKLVPLEQNLQEWSEIYVRDGLKNPQVYDYLMTGPHLTADEFVKEYNETFMPSTHLILLAVLLKAGTVSRTDPVTGEVTPFEVEADTFAGFSGLGGKPEHATAMMGLMLCTPFHRTFVSTHVNGLMLKHLLDSPELGGLGLRRVEWQCNASNKASVRTAKRIGFQWEGITRWHQVMPQGKTGSKGAELEREGLPKVAWDGKTWAAGRHTANLSLCWDDWVNGGREHVELMMKR